MDLIKPKEIELKDLDGDTHKFIISRFNALDGYELISNFPKTMFNKGGESFKDHKEVLIKIFSHVEAFKQDGNTIRLTSEALINNHIPDYELLMKILKEVGTYNSSFLGNVSGLSIIDQIKTKLPTLAQKILMDSLKQLSKKD